MTPEPPFVITALDCCGIFVCFYSHALEAREVEGRLDGPSETGASLSPAAVPHPRLVPASTFTLTDAPQPMEPAGRVREVTVEVWVWGAQEIQKHEELLGTEAGWCVAKRARPFPSLARTQRGPGLTIAWILVGPGLWGADSMSWARCREP